MAGQFLGVGGVARKVKNQFFGVGGVARKVKGGFLGVGGVARKFFTGEAKVSWFQFYVESGTVDGQNFEDEENWWLDYDGGGFYVTYTGSYSEISITFKGRIEAVLSDGSSCPLDQLIANGYAKSSVQCNFRMTAKSEIGTGDYENRIGGSSGTIMGSKISYSSWNYHGAGYSACDVSVTNPSDPRCDCSVFIQTELSNNKQKELILSGSVVVDGVRYDLEGAF